MKRWWYWLVSACVLLIVWCAPVPYRIDIGRFDSAVVTGLYPVEYGAGTTFRWTEPQAVLHLDGVGSGPATLSMMVSAAVEQPVTIRVAGTTTPYVIQPGFRTISIPVAVPFQTTGRLDVHIDTAVPYRDGRRDVGIAIDDVRILPIGWQFPALASVVLSVVVVILGAFLLRMPRASLALRMVCATMLVGAVIGVRRGDAHSILTVMALVSSVALAAAYAQRWNVRWRWATIVIVSIVAMLLVWWRGAIVWQPIWQLVVLLGSVALLRLRRFVWAHVKPFRFPLGGAVFVAIASQSYPLAGCGMGAVLVWYWGRRINPSHSRLHALVYAAYSIVPTVAAWLRGGGVVRGNGPIQSRSVGLDYLRGVVVLFVLMAHTPTVAVYGNDWVVTGVHWLVKFAVEAFFILSGWLIGDLLIAQLDQWSQPRALALFLHRRWARTLPIYWLVLVVVILAGWSGATPASMWTYVLFVQNMWQIHPPYFLVAWSLSIEEWFYFTAAVVLSIAARRMHPKCALLVTLVLLIAVPFVVRSWLSWTTDWSWNDAIRQYVPLRLDAIASGVALVWAWRSWPLVRRYAGLWVGLAIGLVMLYIAAVQYWQPVWEHIPWVRVTLIPVMSLGIMALFPFLAGIQRPQPSIVERGLQWISMLSYPLYLLHYPVRQTVQGLIGAAGSSVWADIVVTVVFYAGSFWVALQWHRELEQPIMRLRLRQ